MRIDINTKVLLNVSLVCIVLSFAVLPLSYFYNTSFSKIINSETHEAVEAIDESVTDEFYEVALDSARIISQTVERSLNHHLGDKTLEQLMHDNDFDVVTGQKYYKTGYIAIVDLKNYNFITHSYSELKGKNIYDAPGYQKDQFKPILSALASASQNEGVGLKYQLMVSRDKTVDQFMYLTPFVSKTKDGVSLVVLAAIPSSDFDARSLEVKNILNQKISESTVNTDVQTSLYITKLVFMLLLVFVIAILVAMIFSRRLSGRVAYLTNACQKISGGAFDDIVKKIDSKDEIEDLSVSIEGMRSSLVKQSEIIKNKSKIEQDKTRELEEALAIAEEKTKQLISENRMNKK